MEILYKIIQQWFVVRFGFRPQRKDIINFVIHTFPIQLSEELPKLLPYTKIIERELGPFKLRKAAAKKLYEICKRIGAEKKSKNVLIAMIAIRAFSIEASTRQLRHYRVLQRKVIDWLLDLLATKS